MKTLLKGPNEHNTLGKCLPFEWSENQSDYVVLSLQITSKSRSNNKKITSSSKKVSSIPAINPIP
jgi:hypothetical protein